MLLRTSLPQLSHSNWLKMSLNISELQSRQILQIYIKRTLFLLWSELGLTLLVGLHSPCLLLVALTKNEGPAQVFVPFICSFNFYFKTLDQAISSFIWNKGPVRIRKTILQRTKASGGACPSKFPSILLGSKYTQHLTLAPLPLWP